MPTGKPVNHKAATETAFLILNKRTVPPKMRELAAAYIDARDALRPSGHAREILDQ
jgi:hypothetical protein